MVFSSAIFLFCFLPAVFLLYRLPFGRRWQNALLACASLVFYAFGNLHYVPLFLLSVLLNYVTGLLLGGRLQRSKPLIALNIVLNLGILCVFKYTDFLIGNGCDFDPQGDPAPFSYCLLMNVPVLSVR